MGQLQNGLEIVSSGGSIDWGARDNSYFLNPRLPKDQAQFQIESLKQIAEQFQSTLFLLTSGTTSGAQGRVKWVALSHAAFLRSAAEVNLALGSEPEMQDFWLHVLPDFHVGGLAIRARSFLSRAQSLTLDRWSVGGLMDALSSHPVTLLSLVPAQVFDLCQARLQCPPSVRAVLVGGSALSPALHRQATQLGWPIRLTYAMTETCSTIGMTPAGLHFESESSQQFELLPHFEARVDETLWLSGESLTTGYIEADSHGRACVTDPKQEGWFKTTDRVRLAGRQIEFLGRIGDLIKIGGEKVELARLNQILEEIRLMYPSASDFALVAFPDERLGHVIHLVGDAKTSSESMTLVRTEFNSRVLPFEKIRAFHQLDCIPRTDLGKLLSQECLKKILGRAPSQ